MVARLELLWSQTTSATVGALVWTLLAFELFALLSVPSVLLRRRGRPTVALAWLFALFALPAIGGLTWWLFGRTRIERKRRKRAQKKRSFVAQRGSPESMGGTIFDKLLPERAQGDSVFTSRGNEIELYLDGKTAFRELERAIDGAQKCIHLLYYIFQDDATGRRIADRLIEKARQGVKVRFLVDGFGSQAATRRLRRYLKKSGVDVAVFIPSRLSPLHAPRVNFTNHRKIATVDGKIAFTGGMNVGAEYELHWRDMMVRVEGPAVLAFDHIFLEDWYYATDETVFQPDSLLPIFHEPGVDVAVVASGPDTESWIHDAYFLAITRAQKRVWIVTPYFIPTAPIIEALRTAAGRGVDVRIVVPDKSDVVLVKWASRSYYRMLIATGVHIYEYQGPMLHAKALLADDTLCSVGSANIDSRSFGLSFEVSCFWESQELHRALEAWFADLVEHAAEITAKDLDGKPVTQKLAESAAHLLSPIL